MSILINKNTRVICQGITGKVGQFHTKGCKEYGTQMVGGVTPGKGGEAVEGVPVFDTVMEAVEKTAALQGLAPQRQLHNARVRGRRAQRGFSAR